MGGVHRHHHQTSHHHFQDLEQIHKKAEKAALLFGPNQTPDGIEKDTISFGPHEMPDHHLQDLEQIHKKAEGAAMFFGPNKVVVEKLYSGNGDYLEITFLFLFRIK